MSGGSDWSYNRFDKFEEQINEGSCGTKGYQEGGEVKCEKDECKHCEGKGCEKCEDKKEKEEVKEGAMHRDAKTGEVVDKAEIGKIYYPAQPKKKTSVAKRKEEVKEGAKPDFLDLDKDGNKEESMKKAASEKSKKSLRKEDLEATGLFTAEEVEQIQEVLGLGKRLTPEEKAKKDREKKINELERKAKHLANPFSDVNTSKRLKKEGFSEEEIEALEEKMTTEGALNPFQVHFDKDGKEYTSKGTKEQRDKITKNREEMAKKRAKDAYKSRAGESD